MRIKAIALTLSTIGLLAAGCGKKETSEQTTMDSVSKAATQMAQQTQSAPNAATKSPSVAVPAKTLAGFLATPAGFAIQGEPETMEMDMNGVKYTHATAEYTSGDKRIKTSIIDYNYIAGLSAAYTAMLNMNMETNDESWHTDKIAGFPAWFDWKKKSSSGTVGVFVGDRIFVVTEGSGGVTQEELKAAASAVNYSGIASAAK